ncbi:YfcL family protein [Vibrio sp. JC009]|uniref:YfcL family protein n=1 Tax=Vibrio sp. JC009 TaxID=2912314 RepID=UPI0023AEBCB5|nr:YfcL family protein [Vibrio sp. JC009]WED23303.1 YfcL family protein [Vibrio sp. JC009]
MILDFEEKLLELIDSSVESASEDELFAGGYLRGHISLSAAACESEGIDDLETFKARIEASIEEAKSELSPADRVVVNDMWQQLVGQL